VLLGVLTNRGGAEMGQFETQRLIYFHELAYLRANNSGAKMGQNTISANDPAVRSQWSFVPRSFASNRWLFYSDTVL
jgi:hypothetical protein